jgi:hypothetical protein
MEISMDSVTIPIRRDGVVLYVSRDDLRKALPADAWKQFKKWYGVRTSRADGPYLSDVLEWADKYCAGRSSIMLSGM